MTGDPARAFADLARRYDRMFWLDGGGSRTWSGRRSLLGYLTDDDVSLTYDASAREVSRHQGGRADVVGDDVFAVLGDEVTRDAGDRSVHWVGYLGYGSRRDLPASVEPPGPGRVPDAVWMRVRDPLVFEHDPGVPATTPAPGTTSVPPVASPPDYREAFDEVQRQLHAGNSYEVNLTYRELVDSDVDPVDAYLRLRRVNPAPYAGYLQHGGTALLSSSPERYATVDRDGWVETKPIKGTTPRSSTPDEDAALAERLRTDPRFRSENLMIVDLLRNDLSMVCAPGTVTVPALMQVESYANVHQLVSTVRGRLRDGVGTVEALRALFPAGSMTGAPKLRTMQIIEAVESGPRGVYSGAFGWICADGRADLGVVIRSLVARPAPADAEVATAYRYTLGTGGGITVRSDVDEEYAETRWKAARLRTALQRPSGRSATE